MSQETGEKPLLIVDDREDVAEMLGMMAREGGAETDVHTDPDEAIQALEENEYAGLWTDFNMPGKTGVDVAEKAISEKGPYFPVAIITADPQDERIQAFKNNEGKGVVVVEKPVDMDKMIDLAGRFKRRGRIAPYLGQSATLRCLRPQEIITFEKAA